MTAGHVPGGRGVVPGTKSNRLPCSRRIPLPHSGAHPPLCGKSANLGGMIMSIFTKAYWQSAAAELKKVNRLTLAAFVIALVTVAGTFAIPVSQNLHIVFTFLFFAFGAIIYGPVVAAATGATADIVGFIAHPSGAFFPGYTLSAILSGLIYGLFLYRQRITVLRLILVKLIINYGINVGLGCLWSAMLFGKAYSFFFIASLLKNTLMLPIEVAILYVTLQVLLPILAGAHLLPGSKSQ